MESIITILVFTFGVGLILYIGYVLGHIEGFRKGIDTQRKIYRKEL